MIKFSQDFGFKEIKLSEVNQVGYMALDVMLADILTCWLIGLTSGTIEAIISQGPFLLFSSTGN